jgi:AraC-like DNA-binding protein
MNVKVEFKEPGALLKPYINYYLFADIVSSYNPLGNSGYRLIHIPNSEIELHLGYQDTASAFGFVDQKPEILRAAIVGANDLNYTMSIIPGCMIHKTIVVRFRPRGFYEIFGVPLSAVINKVYEAEQLLGNGIFSLYDQIDHAANNTERVAYVERFLTRYFLINHKINSSYERVMKAVDLISLYQGRISLSYLLSFLGTSERPLQRDFKTFLGITPKQFCCMMRIQFLLSALEKHSLDECDLVYKLGYYDQPHMINEFKKATTVTPYSYQNHRNKDVFKVFNTLILTGEMANDPLCNDIVSAAEKGYRSFYN